MRKFVISRIRMGNVANFKDFEVKVSGKNLIVTGQNGTGKTTFGKAILWALLGGTADGEKLMPIDGGLPYTEVDLSDGVIYTKIRKEITQKVDSKGRISRSTSCLVNGLPVQLRELHSFICGEIDSEVFQALISLGSFFKLKAETQRAILTKNFSDVDEEALKKEPEFKELQTVDASKMKALKKRLEATLKTIPVKIDTLTAQMKEVTPDKKVLEGELAALEVESAEIMKSLTVANSDETPAQNLRQAKFEIQLCEKEYKALSQKINSAKTRLSKLRSDYENMPRVCPTCGQKIQGQNAAKIRETIVVESKEVAAEIKSDEVELQEIISRGKVLREKIQVLEVEVQKQKPSQAQLEAATRLKNLRGEISARQAQIAQIDAQNRLNEENQRRIDELLIEEKKLGQKVTDCDRQLNLIGKYIRRKTQLVADSINGKFRFIKFKMFETSKSGEVKNVCDATMNGVEYDNLSKGEKLKAGLDLLNTFQEFYGVMFPLIIDDAESYTSNSLIEVTNQRIMLMVVEGQKELEVLAQ